MIFFVEGGVADAIEQAVSLRHMEAEDLPRTQLLLSQLGLGTRMMGAVESRAVARKLTSVALSGAAAHILLRGFWLSMRGDVSSISQGPMLGVSHDGNPTMADRRTSRGGHHRLGYSSSGIVQDVRLPNARNDRHYLCRGNGARDTGAARASE